MTTTIPRVSVTPTRTYAPRKRVGAVIWDWMTTVDHKKIGIMYIFLGIIYFIVGGIEALLIRIQLATPNERHGKQHACCNRTTHHHSRDGLGGFASPVALADARGRGSVPALAAAGAALRQRGGNRARLRCH